MILPYNQNLKKYSRSLRKNMTEAEKRLWSKIRGKKLLGFQFYRQKILGNYIVDFYCPAGKIVIELDGGQHFSDEGRRKDEERDQFLFGLGFTSLRFSDEDVFKNLNGVLEVILEQLSCSPLGKRN